MFGCVRAKHFASTALFCVLFVLAAGCDRRSVRRTGGEAPNVVAGPRTVAGGVLFVLEDPAAQSVHVSGPFNDWSTSADPMANDGKGRWTLVKRLQPGTHQYKFVIDGGRVWRQDPENAQKQDDGFGGSNSVVALTHDGVIVTVPTVPSAAAAPGAAATGGPKQLESGWRFAFEMSDAASVHLAGTFNDWSTSSDPMQRDASGVWVLVKKLPPGQHQYKFVVNGGQMWKEDPNNPNSSDDGYGGKNSTLVVP